MRGFSSKAVLVFINQRINIWKDRVDSHDKVASIQELRRVESFIENNMDDNVNVLEDDQ